MAVISHQGLNRTVANLAARDAISPKVDGMTVTVNDTTGDPIAGSGVGTYKWVQATNSWLLTADDDSVTFTAQEKTKLSGISPGATAINTAADLSYSNIQSGIIATNVQTALDEVHQVALSSATDHGTLGGLADDDHPQYLNTVRGDIRYYTKSEIDTLFGSVADFEAALI